MNIAFTTRNSALFYRIDGDDYCAGSAEITDIKWDGRADSGRCQYCGHDYTGEECPGCAARRKEKIAVTGKATFSLRGYCHPHNAWIMSLPRHLELHYAWCGRVDDYENWDMRAIFTDCETTFKEVTNPNSFSVDEVVMFHAEATTNVLIQYENPGRQLIP